MDVKGIIEFEDVHFSYPTRKEHPVLNGLSWVANPGETIALVGHSGCGKSTSVSLDLMVVYSHCNCNISLDFQSS